MRTIQACRGYYKIKRGLKEYKIYASDLKMISKRRCRKTPALPVYYEDDEMDLEMKMKRKVTDIEK